MPRLGSLMAALTRKTLDGKVALITGKYHSITLNQWPANNKLPYENITVCRPASRMFYITYSLFANSLG